MAVLYYYSTYCCRLAEWLYNMTVQKLVLVIKCTDTNEVLERWQFNVECDKTASEDGCVYNSCGSFFITFPIRKAQSFCMFQTIYKQNMVRLLLTSHRFPVCACVSCLAFHFFPVSGHSSLIFQICYRYYKVTQIQLMFVIVYVQRDIELIVLHRI